MPTNWHHPIRAKLQAGESVIGATITTPSIESAALIATLGFDFLWVEMEHSPILWKTLRAIVLSNRALPAPVFARVPVVELWTAKRVMDQGVSGVIFPFASTPDRARTAAAACKYPPHGKRGSGAGTRHVHLAGAGRLLRFGRPEHDDDSRHRRSIGGRKHRGNRRYSPASTSSSSGPAIFLFLLGLRGRQEEPLLDENIAKIVAAGKKHGKFLGPSRWIARAGN